MEQKSPSFKRSNNPLFGGSLRDALTDNQGKKHEIPPFIEGALEYITTNALDVQGIFREPGSKVEIEELVSKINAHEDIKFGQKYKNFFTVADMIKLYLRQLKEPLIPVELYNAFYEAVTRESDQMKLDLKKVRLLLHMVPAENSPLLKRVLGFLHVVAQHSQKNKMSASNLALMFASAFLRGEGSQLAIQPAEIMFLVGELISADQTVLFTYPSEYENTPPATSESASSFLVYLVLNLPQTGFETGSSWPSFNEQGDLYVVNGSELYIYPDRSAFIRAYLSELYCAVDSSRYYYFTNDDGKVGIIFGSREESAAFRAEVEKGLGYPIPIGTSIASPSPATLQPAVVGKPKPSQPKPIADPFDVLTHEIGEQEKIGDKWFDVGGESAFLNKSLAEIIKIPPDMKIREVILVDKSDTALARILKITQLLASRFPTLESKVRVIALQVSNALGGNFEADTKELCDKQIAALKQELQSNVIPLGSVTHGMLRHRVLLFKFICDHLEPPVPCMVSHSEEDGSLVNLVPVSSNINKYKAVDLLTAPGRLRTQARDRKVLWTQVSESRTSERHIILPDLQSEDVVFHEKLGQGGFSQVYRCSIGPITCAVKVYAHQDEKIGKELVRECMIQSRLSHKNVVRCLGFEKKGAEFFIFLEFCAQGSFWDIIHMREGKAFSAKEIAYYAGEVAQGLAYLHQNKIFHRDIKSANILVDGDPYGEYYRTIKLTDFNISTSRAGVQTRVGTPQYMAPELLLHKTEIDTAKTDIWSYGMFLIELLTLNAPYAGLEENIFTGMIQRGELPPNVPKTGKTMELVRRCCHIDPNQRPTAEEIVAFLNPLG